MVHKIQCQRGMSLVQVLVAIAITVMTGVFVMQTVLQMKKVEVLMNLNSEAQDVEIGIQRVLMNAVACQKTLEEVMQPPPTGVGMLDEAKVIAGVELKNIYTEKPHTATSPPVPIFKVTQTFGGNKLIIHRMRLLRSRPGELPSPGWDNTVATLYLEVVLKKSYLATATATPAQPIDTPGGEYMVRRIPLLARVNDVGNVETCTSLAEADLAKKICEVDLEGQMVAGTCSLANSPVVRRVVCDALSSQWISGTTCSP